jgi:hypothetical protein
MLRGLPLTKTFTNNIALTVASRLEGLLAAVSVILAMGVG